MRYYFTDIRYDIAVYRKGHVADFVNLDITPLGLLEVFIMVWMSIR